MSAKLIFRKKTYEVQHGTTIRDAILQLEVPPEAVLPTRGGEFVPEDELINENDVIKLVKVISGG